MTAMQDAARSGDTERLLALLEQGADPDGPDEAEEADGRTPLGAAAAAGQLAAVELLLERGANPDHAGPDGESALYAAAARGLTEVVARLLAEPGVDPNRRSERGWGPLTVAAFAGHAPVVRLLLADPRLRAAARDAQGRTALWWAATGGRTEAAELLATHGTGARLTDDDGVDPVDAAAAAGHPDLAAELRRMAAARPAGAAGTDSEDVGDDRYQPPDEPPAGRVIREPAWRLREGR
jgi:ankyrin repeat protein